jgi:superfamily II DNA or RNA helicase
MSNKINAILTPRGLEVNMDDLIKKYTKDGLKKIQNKFIIKYKSPIGSYFISKILYFIHDGIIIFPRFLGFNLYKSNIITNISNTIQDGESIDMKYTGKSNQNQLNIINYIMGNIYTQENLAIGKCGLTLKVLAGFGKSFIAMDLISRINQKALIIVPNTYLLKQWVELLTKYFPENTIGEYYGKTKKNGDIIVSIINSLVNETFTLKDYHNKKIKYNYNYEDFFKQFGFIILDESHIYCTDIFKVIYHRFQSSYMLGLSATPDERTNKCDLISHANIGQVLDAHKLPDFIHSDIKFSADLHLIKYNAPDEYVKIHINPTTNMVCVPQIIEDLVNDSYRNKLILNELFNLFELKLNIFVFSERRSHLEYLYNQFNYLLEEKYTEDNYNSNLSIPELEINNNLVLYGGSSDDDIETAKNKSNIIFTTYSYSSTGVSIDKMNAVILTTPRKSKAKQIIGRIFRLNKENSHIKRIIIDIIDNKSILKNQLYSRMEAYKERECNIYKKNINYNEIE